MAHWAETIISSILPNTALGRMEEALRQALSSLQDNFRCLFAVYSSLKEMKINNINLIEENINSIYSINSIFDRISAIIEVSHILFEEGCKNQAKSVIREAWKLAYNIRSDKDKAAFLCSIAIVLSEINDGIEVDNVFVEAEEITHTVQEKTWLSGD
jgi:hypothetical protein